MPMTNNHFKESFRGSYWMTNDVRSNDEPITAESIIRAYNFYVDELLKEIELYRNESTMYREALDGSQSVVKALRYRLDEHIKQIDSMNEHGY